MIKYPIIGLFLASGISAHAQAIHIRGKISNPAGQAVSGAVVELALRKLKDTTGADGMYSLAGSVAIGRQPLPFTESMGMHGNFLELILSRSQTVKLEVFDARGNLLKREERANAAAGAHRWNLSEYAPTNNIQVIKVSAGGQERTFLHVPLAGARPDAPRPALEDAPTAARLAKASPAAVDTLNITAAGFPVKKVPLLSYDTLLNVSLAPSNGEPSPGCANATAAKGARMVTIQVNGRARTYLLFVPNAYVSTKSIPLIFAWHGSGGDGEEVRRYFKLEAATGDGAIVIYPDGLNGGWDLAAEGIDVQFFDAMLTATARDYCVDQTRVFTTGYSFGGMMSHSLACSRGGKLRGLAPTAGAFLRGVPSNGCATPVPAWIAHGTNDNLVGFAQGQAARDVWLKTNGCGAATQPTSPSPCVAYTCSKAPVHWCVHNEGHVWGSFTSKGLWAFFQSL